MNTLHKQAQQPTIETWSYCALNHIYTISIMTWPLRDGGEFIESWYNRQGEGVMNHAVGIMKKSEEDVEIVMNAAVECIEEDDKED